MRSGRLDVLVDAVQTNCDIADALPRMVAEQSETLLLHELGEHRAGE